jgi:hypothetical protein
VKWVDSSTSTSSTCRFQRISRSPNVPSQSRQYSICLQPAIIPSVGPLISSLVSSGVAKYSGFKLLESVSIYDSPGKVKSVPGSKEDIFKNKQISLIEKRRLMRFLTFAAGEFEDQKELEGKAELPFPEFLRTIFSLSEEIASVITYALAFCMSPNGVYGALRCRDDSYLLIRTCTADAGATAQVPPLRRTLRPLAFLDRPLWRHRRHCARILPCVRSQRRCIHSWTQYHFNCAVRPFQDAKDI